MRAHKSQLNSLDLRPLNERGHVIYGAVQYRRISPNSACPLLKFTVQVLRVAIVSDHLLAPTLGLSNVKLVIVDL